MSETSESLEIGTDIIAISRFAKSLERYEDKFIKKMFTKNEQDYCKKHSDYIPHFAARFSAKEAVAKALGCGISKHLSFLDIEVLNNELGKPYIVLSKDASKHFGNPKIKISISHCKEYATAIAIAIF